MQLSEVFVTLHMYYPHPLHSSPISGFYFTSLHFYSIFASPFYYCYNILHDFYPLFSFVLFCIILYFIPPSLISFSLFQCLDFSSFPYSAFLFVYEYNWSFLILQSYHFILSLLFSNIFSLPSYRI